jgi:hypothetical protein
MTGSTATISSARQVEGQKFMKKKITRRDFINGVSIAAAGAAIGNPRALWVKGTTDSGPAPVGADDYPPALTGLRGNHDGAYEVAHALAWDGKSPASTPTSTKSTTWSSSGPVSADSRRPTSINSRPDMANTLVFLCSDAASGMNGESFLVDQGQVNATMSGGYVPEGDSEG